MHKYVLTIET